MSNQIHSLGLRSYQVWDEAKKLFTSVPSNKYNPEPAMTEKELALSDVTLLSKFALWIDLRTTNDVQLHGSERKLENASAGL